MDRCLPIVILAHWPTPHIPLHSFQRTWHIDLWVPHATSNWLIQFIPLEYIISSPYHPHRFRFVRTLLSIKSTLCSTVVLARCSTVLPSMIFQTLSLPFFPQTLIGKAAKLIRKSLRYMILDFSRAKRGTHVIPQTGYIPKRRWTARLVMIARLPISGRSDMTSFLALY